MDKMYLQIKIHSDTGFVTALSNYAENESDTLTFQYRSDGSILLMETPYAASLAVRFLYLYIL